MFPAPGGGAAAVQPCVRGGSAAAEAEQFVEERPQEHPAQSDPDAGERVPGRGVSAAHDNAATVAILYGRQDDDAGRLRAGEALSAAWLTATELGMSVLPLSATIEVTVSRERIRHLLAGLGHPHLVLRLTIGDPAATAAPHTPRLPPTRSSNGSEADHEQLPP